jgi:glutamate formiminotransferase/formiminotetrahydrofolate cyclodeaminase
MCEIYFILFDAIIILNGVVMDRIIECVPNFSEGRDAKVIHAISNSIQCVRGVNLLNVESNADYNRTVITFVGQPESVLDAAFISVKTASDLIDMQGQSGEHPRLGAADVVPFIPIAGATLEECAVLARTLGKRVGSELRIPVYLYEAAATSPDRKRLERIRKGGYEKLSERMLLPEWKPDFGPAEPDARSGAIAIGARDFLIAYNITLISSDKSIAHEIAVKTREFGSNTLNENGIAILDQDRNQVRVPGKLKHIKALGIYLNELNLSQVSINITNYHVTPLHTVFETVKKEAVKLGTKLLGSEIVGLVPLEAMISTGRYYARLNNDAQLSTNKDLIKLTVDRLGLDHLAPFHPESKILDYLLQ